MKHALLIALFLIGALNLRAEDNSGLSQVRIEFDKLSTKCASLQVQWDNLQDEYLRLFKSCELSQESDRLNAECDHLLSHCEEIRESIQNPKIIICQK
jgi:hypothetical protein